VSWEISFVLYITVFYHRGLAHEAVILSPLMQRFVAWTGSWVTGIDAKAWVCLHRLHHQYPNEARFSHRWFEWDWGCQLCQLLSLIGVLRIARSTRT